MNGRLQNINGFGRTVFCLAAIAACAAHLQLNASAEPLTSWHVRESGVTGTFEGITYGAGVFVAVGEDGTILSSPDGVTWSKEVSSVTTTLEDVKFANGIFVAVGRGSTLLTSPDGHAWTKQVYDQGSGPVNLIHDGTRFVLLKAGASISVSTNGINWTQKGAVGAKYDAAGIAFGNNTYVEVGYKRTGQPTDVYSAPAFDGPWEKRDGKVDDNLMGVGFAKGLFIAVGQDGIVSTSPDGVEWTLRDSKTSGFIWNVTSGGPYVVACGQWGRLLVSENATDWTRMEVEEVAGHLKDIVYGQGTFVAVGWDGAIVQSNVIETPEAGEIHLTAPAWSNDSFTCQFNGTVGTSYTLEATADGKTWSQRDIVLCDKTPMVVSDMFADGRYRFYRVTKY